MRCRRRSEQRRRDEHGFATAEIAVALPALMVVLQLCLAGVGAVTAQMQCIDAAREGARAAARAEPIGLVLASARQVAPRGAQVTVTAAGDLVRVRVHARVGTLGMLDVSATAVAHTEPGVGR